MEGGFKGSLWGDVDSCVQELDGFVGFFMLEFDCGVERVEVVQKVLEGGFSMGPDHENVINVALPNQWF